MTAAVLGLLLAIGMPFPSATPAEADASRAARQDTPAQVTTTTPSASAATASRRAWVIFAVGGAAAATFVVLTLGGFFSPKHD